MPIYFLTPKLLNPADQEVSGGSISNLRLLEEISRCTTVICIPMLFAGIPESLERKKSISLFLPKNKGSGRLRYLIERYTRYEKRVEQAIHKHGKGPIIATRATIPVAHRIASRLGTPLIIITRAFEDLEQAGLRTPSDRQTLFRRLEGALQRRSILSAYRSADLVLTNSEFMKQETQRLFGTSSPFHVLYPAMDLPRGKPTKSIINSIGFINKGTRKGKKLILDLACRLPDKNFRIFGEPLAPGNECPANLENVGYVNDRLAMFGGADLFLVPSLWDEPYGRVAAEAIWCGKPVIVSMRGGLLEAAPDELFWEQSADPERWKKKIEWLDDEAHSKPVTDAIENAQRLLARHEHSLDHDISVILNAGSLSK